MQLYIIEHSGNVLKHEGPAAPKVQIMASLDFPDEIPRRPDRMFTLIGYSKDPEFAIYQEDK